MQTLYSVRLSFGYPRQRVYRSSVRCLVTGTNKTDATARAIAWAETNPHQWRLPDGGSWRVDEVAPIVSTADTIKAIPF